MLEKIFFTIAFGANWSEAGVYAQILSFSIFMRFITGPASYLVLIFEKQEYSLFLRVFEILVGIISITIGGLLGNVYISFFLLSVLTGLLYAVYGFWLMSLAGLSISKIFKIIWHFLVISSPVLIVVSLVKWGFCLSPFFIIVISCLGAIIFYSIELKRDEKIRSIVVEFLSKLNIFKIKKA